jgi:hypothetical protein
MGGRRLIAVCCALASAGALAVAGSALAGPSQDFVAVYAAWSDSGAIPHCRFNSRQLVNAREESKTVEDFKAYSPSFEGDVNREIAFNGRGGCRGVARPPSKARLAKSALRKVKLGGVSPKGRESVVLVNTGTRRVNLAGATLRDRAGHRVRLGGTLARKARRRVFSRGVWDNGGDVVKLVDRRRLVVRQTGFGRWAGVVRF